jgi:hypothetical protein
MTDEQRQELDRLLSRLSDWDKRELADRLLREAASTPPDPDRAERQYEARMRLLEKIEALPSAPPPDDGFSNRDHDRVIYTR